MLDRAPSPRLAAVRAPALPVAAMVLGRPVDEAAALLPRLFNLCRAAQGAAARMAFGLPPDPAAPSLAQEILRDHLMKFHVTWPAFFGAPPSPLPADWAAGGRALVSAVFGPTGRAPAAPADVDAFFASDHGVAPVLRRIAGSFAPGEADAGALPPVTPATAFTPAPVDNSVAARQAHQPGLAHIAATRGHGPLWRAAARAWDMAEAATGRCPAPVSPASGRALVPAARGLYAVTARVSEGRVAAFDRVTPTDHLLAPCGVLDRALATLPAEKHGLAPLLLDILDPCSPVRLKEATDA